MPVVVSHGCAEMLGYIENFENLLKLLRTSVIRGELPSVDDMVDLFLGGVESDPDIDCRWLAVNLALALQKLVLA